MLLRRAPTVLPSLNSHKWTGIGVSSGSPSMSRIARTVRSATPNDHRYSGGGAAAAAGKRLKAVKPAPRGVVRRLVRGTVAATVLVGHSGRRDEGNFFVTKGLSHALGLEPSPS